eukprot:12502152-Ditylum_brightwellii.AAC.1
MASGSASCARGWPQEYIDDEEVTDLAANGMSVYCVLCNKKVPSRRPFYTCWKDHKTTSKRHIAKR